VIFLLGFRIGLNIADSNVIDVGYSGVIGADRLLSGEPLYGAFPEDNPSGDTYGPVNYLAYVPFVAALGWDDTWSDLPAAHGAAIAFDVLAVALAFLLGRRARGPVLGVALAYAWVSFPFTFYVLNSNANDALVAVLVLGAVLAAVWSSRPLAAAARGSLAALAGLTKLGPLALGALLLTHRGEGERLRPATTAVFLAAFTVVAALAFVPVLAGGGSLRAFWDATLAFQLERGSPFSVWGQWDLGTAQKVVQGAAVALAVAVAFVTRRRDAVGLSALCAAILIALQLGVTHWFYLYIVWFFPLVMLAVLVTSTEGHRSR
ncbi:MAG: glycosyltransferase 87 family protein, partial [Actinomycetota bacterium]|nr:glycosyltransferase 87 family protein [Actinomycetota bacterium]